MAPGPRQAREWKLAANFNMYRCSMGPAAGAPLTVGPRWSLPLSVKRAPVVEEDGRSPPSSGVSTMRHFLTRTLPSCGVGVVPCATARSRRKLQGSNSDSLALQVPD
jgi:hypothetical protein